MAALLLVLGPVVSGDFVLFDDCYYVVWYLKGLACHSPRMGSVGRVLDCFGLESILSTI